MSEHFEDFEDFPEKAHEDIRFFVWDKDYTRCINLLALVSYEDVIGIGIEVRVYLDVYIIKLALVCVFPRKPPLLS